MLALLCPELYCKPRKVTVGPVRAPDQHRLKWSKGGSPEAQPSPVVGILADMALSGCVSFPSPIPAGPARRFALVPTMILTSALAPAGGAPSLAGLPAAFYREVPALPPVPEVPQVDHFLHCVPGVSPPLMARRWDAESRFAVGTQAIPRLFVAMLPGAGEEWWAPRLVLHMLTSWSPAIRRAALSPPCHLPSWPHACMFRLSPPLQRPVTDCATLIEGNLVLVVSGVGEDPLARVFPRSNVPGEDDVSVSVVIVSTPAPVDDGGCVVFEGWSEEGSVIWDDHPDYHDTDSDDEPPPDARDEPAYSAWAVRRCARLDAMTGVRSKFLL